MATSSVIGSVAKSRAASSSTLHRTSGAHARVAAQGVGHPVLAEELLAGTGFGQPVGVEEQQVADVERDLPAGVLAVGVEHQQRPGGAERAHLAVVPQPRGGMTGRRHAQRGRLRVEHDDADRDELLEALERRHLPVELLQRLRRIAVLAEEHAQQVLGLEGGDGRLDAMPGDVADDRRDAGGRHAEHVVEVAGHETGAGLVHPPELEAGEVGQVLGGQAGGPAASAPAPPARAPPRPAARAGCGPRPVGLRDGSRAPYRTDSPTGTRMNAKSVRPPLSVFHTAATAAATASTA